MPDVARALVLPDPIPPSTDQLLTLLLCWESLDVVILPETAAVLTAIGEPFDELVDHGLISRSLANGASAVFRYAPDAGFEPPAANAAAEEIARSVCERIGVDDFGDLFGGTFANQLGLQARLVCEDADRCGLPSVAVGQCSAAAASVPAKEPAAPRSEAALVSAAIQGVSVLPGTTVEDVVSFRERDASPTAVTEQAQATIKNRVEPALADLEDVLKRGRIRYAWKTLTGATSVLLGLATPTVAVTSSSRIASQALDYAFDRDKLIREHRYGLLHAIRAEFGERPNVDWSTLLRCSLSEFEARYVEALRELAGAAPAFETTLERTRSIAARTKELSVEEEESQSHAMRDWRELDAKHIEVLRTESYARALLAVLRQGVARSNDLLARANLPRARRGGRIS